MSKNIACERIEDELSPGLLRELEEFRRKSHAEDEGLPFARAACTAPHFIYYGKDVLEKSVIALLCQKNLLLAGPKATGKNVLAENLAYLFGRPSWNVSFHINVDAAYLIGADTYDGSKVVFRPGPISRCAQQGGFGVLDEINMAKNEAMAVLHAALDHRRFLEISGYDRIDLHNAARFIGTMNYGYAGTRELNEALSSRFVVVQMQLIEEKQLRRLMTREYPEIGSAMLDQLCAVFYELEKKAGNAEISTRSVDLRGLLDAVSLMRAGMKPVDAMDLCVANKVFDPTEREVIKDVIAARLPKSWR